MFEFRNLRRLRIISQVIKVNQTDVVTRISASGKKNGQPFALQNNSIRMTWTLYLKIEGGIGAAKAWLPRDLHL
jgi:hypothetical protein